MRTEELADVLDELDFSIADLADRAGIEERNLEDFLAGRRDLAAASRVQLAAAIRAHASGLERTAAALESDAAPAAPAQPASPDGISQQRTADGHGATHSRIKIAVGALGLLMFIVGVKRFSPGPDESGQP